MKIGLNGHHKAFGVVTSDLQVASQFELVFWETKDVNGVWHQPLPNHIPMVCSFADNRLAKAHPEWIQHGADGQLATRNNKFFNYEWLCPSEPLVRELAFKWIRNACSSCASRHVRLDNVCFAREGYCNCIRCKSQCSVAGIPVTQYREKIITDFVVDCRKLIDGKLYLTVYPDPYPGHLLNRFGMQVSQLKQIVDGFIVPIFDTAYGTTYWLETIAKGFQDLFGDHTWYIELYGEGIEQSRLLKAAQVAHEYAKGVLIAYATDIDMVKSIERELAVT